MMWRQQLRLLPSAALAVAALLLSMASAQAQVKSPTLDAIKKRGELVCGVDTGIPGFAFQDSAGKWKGFDIAYCRAIAAAVLGDPEKVKYIGVTAKVRFTVLQSGEIDVLIRDSTLTFSRDTQLNLSEVAVNLYAGQAFMVRKSLNVASTKQLDGATICMITGATLELNIADYGAANGIKINSLLFEKPEEAFAAAEAGRCDGYTDDSGSVAAARSTMKKPDDWMILPEVISKEPLGIHAREGDEKWTDILKWVHYALLSAEEMGVNKADVEKIKSSDPKDPFMRRLLGLEGDFGKLLGIDNEWSYRAIKASGNYGEIYDEFFGPNALGLPRGLNNLYTKGGLDVSASPSLKYLRERGHGLSSGRGEKTGRRGVCAISLKRKRPKHQNSGIVARHSLAGAAAVALALGFWWLTRTAGLNLADRNLNFGFEFPGVPSRFRHPLQAGSADTQ